MTCCSRPVEAQKRVVLGHSGAPVHPRPASSPVHTLRVLSRVSSAPTSQASWKGIGAEARQLPNGYGLILAPACVRPLWRWAMDRSVLAHDQGPWVWPTSIRAAGHSWHAGLVITAVGRSVALGPTRPRLQGGRRQPARLVTTGTLGRDDGLNVGGSGRRACCGVGHRPRRAGQRPAAAGGVAPEGSTTRASCARTE